MVIWLVAALRPNQPSKEERQSRFLAGRAQVVERPPFPLNVLNSFIYWGYLDKYAVHFITIFIIIYILRQFHCFYVYLQKNTFYPTVTDKL